MIGHHRRNRLQAVELFDGLGPTQLAAIDQLFTELALPAGTHLIAEGGVGREFFVITGGDVEVRKGGRRIARLGPGDFVGEVALIDAAPRNASVRAVTDVRVLVQNRREFASLLDTAPDVRERVRAAAQRRAA
ncbi:MAG TPA: cyclic nucleotide-binding domain-containing protein [Acidimicrobiales bacterium]|nr:cyclic nucleotide-binding domain-containing protein [Acidimicrobiales bacterium]